MNGIRYMSKWFVSEAEAKKFKNEHGGMLNCGKLGSNTRKLHYEASIWHNFNPEIYPYSVSWAEPSTSNSPADCFLD